MRKIALLALAIACQSVPAFATNLNCGMKPMAPIGCRGADAICTCDETGQYCSWQFICGGAISERQTQPQREQTQPQWDYGEHPNGPFAPAQIPFQNWGR
jgi:hypothetical protein